MQALKLLSAEQIRKWDQFTINENKERSIDLMEKAATASVELIVQQFPQKHEFAVFCGCGNNGGDGLAISRLLLALGKKVSTYLINYSDFNSDDFLENERRLKSKNAAHVVDIYQKTELPQLLGHEIIIDAIFGTGLNKTICGIAADAINFINDSQQTVVSIDIPSGLFPDKSSIENTSIVKADTTICFQVPKLAYLFPENGRYVGKWFIVDIGLSNAYYEGTESKTYILDQIFIQSLINKREKFAHKGNFGHALIVAGSLGKIGAAVLSASAALKSGVGLLSIHAPRCGDVILQSTVPEAMLIPDGEDDFISSVSLNSEFEAIGVGPGIGLKEETYGALSNLLRQVVNPMVLDADALNIVSYDPELLKDLPEGSILTPHVKEFERLVGKSNNDFERQQLQLDFSIKHKVIIVLKGAHTAITTPDGKTYFNNNGNPGMAKGGSGDVLTGLLTGLLAQGYSPLNASLIGVFAHGRAGDFAAAKYSQTALTAANIVECLSHVFLELESLKLTK